MVFKDNCFYGLGTVKTLKREEEVCLVRELIKKRDRLNLTLRNILGYSSKKHNSFFKGKTIEQKLDKCANQFIDDLRIPIQENKKYVAENKRGYNFYVLSHSTKLEDLPNAYEEMIGLYKQNINYELAWESGKRKKEDISKLILDLKGKWNIKNINGKQMSLYKPGCEAEYIKIRNEFARHNERLVISIAKRFRSSDLTFFDLVGEGTEGLFRAISKYELRKKSSGEFNKFSTFAMKEIEQVIRLALQNKTKDIRIPVYIQDYLRTYNNAYTKLNIRKSEPSLVEISKEMNVGQHKIEDVLEANAKTGNVLSLNKIISEDESLELQDILIDDVKTVEDLADESYNEKKTLLLIDSTLTEKEAFIIKMRFGLNDNCCPHILEEVGEVFGITRERIRQIEAKALGKLKTVLTSSNDSATIIWARYINQYILKK